MSFFAIEEHKIFKVPTQKIIISIFFLFCVGKLNAQNINQNAVQNIYNNYVSSINKPSNATHIGSAWYRFYKNNFSAQISAQCQFKNTCSDFMNCGLKQKHKFRNFLAGMDRLSECGSSNSVFYETPAFIDSDSQTIIDPFSLYIFEK